MQLRNNGTDVIHFPLPKINHLKAPIGGFRTKPILKWSNDLVLPKPSPTIVLNYLKYRTKEQFLAYKTIYFLKKWKNDKKVNPISFFNEASLHWDSSEKWAKKMLIND